MDENEKTTLDVTSEEVADDVNQGTAEAVSETTATLIENYEDATVPPKKKKKLSKKGKIGLIVTAAVVAAVLVTVLVLMFAGSATNLQKPDLDNNVRPNLASTFTGGEMALINSALASGASDQTVREAIIAIYNRANETKINYTGKVLAAAMGSGTATVAGAADGRMDVRAIRVQDGKIAYYQKAAKLTDCSISALKDVISGVLDQQERYYYSGTGDVYKNFAAKGKNAKVSKTSYTYIPFIKMSAPTNSKIVAEAAKDKSLDEFKASAFVLSDPNEICNFNYTADGIKNATLKFVPTDGSKGYYEMTFDVDVTNDSVVEVARAYLRNSSNSDNLEYSKYKITFQVWDNGYIKKYHDDEVWAGDASIQGTSLSGRSESVTWYESVFYWDYCAELFSEEDQATFNADNWTTNLINRYAAEVGWVD